jgi:hypothetical protein
MDTSIETASGKVESSASFSDVLSNLDMVFMSTFEAQNGRLGLVADLLYIDLSKDVQTPLPLFGDGEVGATTTALSGYVLYRVTGKPTMVLDIGAGFRAFDMDVNLALGPGIAPGFSQSVGDSWIDPLIAARLAVPLDENWSLTGFADWGGSGGNDETWQVFGSFRYAINERWSSQIGYRHMQVSRTMGGRDITIKLGGPVIAVGFEF